MPEELGTVQGRDIQQDREIRRLRLWLQEIAVATGVRATKIVGIVPDDNLPAGAAGGTLVYVSFGDDPSSGGGLSTGSTSCHAADLIVKT